MASLGTNILLLPLFLSLSLSLSLSFLRLLVVPFLLGGHGANNNSGKGMDVISKIGNPPPLAFVCFLLGK